MKQRIVDPDGKKPSLCERAVQQCYGVMACGLFVLFLMGADLQWGGGTLYQGLGGLPGVVIVATLMAATAWTTPLLIRRNPRALWPVRIIIATWAATFLFFGVKGAIEDIGLTEVAMILCGLSTAYFCLSLFRLRVE